MKEKKKTPEEIKLEEEKVQKKESLKNARKALKNARKARYVCACSPSPGLKLHCQSMTIIGKKIKDSIATLEQVDNSAMPGPKNVGDSLACFVP